MKTRCVIFILLGTAVLVLKRHYAGPLEEVVHSYAGNLSVSFALYFYARFSLGILAYFNLRLPASLLRLMAACVAFVAVELFEAFDGFGFMSNTYDPIDFLVNPIGVLLGLGLDTAMDKAKMRNASVSPLRAEGRGDS